MRRAGWLVALAACGRLGFGAEQPPADGARDAAAHHDGTTDGPAPLVVVVDPGPRHIGDDVGGPLPPAEPSPVIDDFTMPAVCGSAALSLEFIGPYGPNMNDEPTLTLNGSDLGHVFPFFPPMTDSGWANGDYNGPNGSGVFDILVTLPCTPVLGFNVFQLATHNTADDMFFDHIRVTCTDPH